ncbi:MAG: carbon-nitrogen hydrolase family protein [Alphaproteobacteria bacterium]|nr:carbon-nitrogen hydrolase family protein [Alphaproteobacteria bacterium]
MAPPINAAVLQLRVRMDIAANMAALERLLAPLPAHTIAVVPEGALSGYLPEPDFVTGIDQAATHAAIDRAAQICRDKQIHLVAGACIHDNGAWRNASLYFGPRGERHRYDKTNLAQSERGTFTPGNALPVFDIQIDRTPVRLGIQMCREIRYPEQWRALAAQGAQIIAYPNNAIGSTIGHDLWRAHLISRAAETQRFILGANNAAADQTCPTMIVAPNGVAIAEAPIGPEAIATASLPLGEVSDWVLSQAREDVVAVTLRSDEL